jgi:RecQ-mediated genome instability protein 1
MIEIGSSAFQLQTVAEQRKDIINGTTLIRRMDDEMDEDDEEAIKQGKMPVYPRGMLKFELGTGDGVVIDAIEYRRLPGIMLGETSLGAKLKVRNVIVLRGIRTSSLLLDVEIRGLRLIRVVMLEPANTEFLGYQVDHLEAEQPAQFLATLAHRMNKPAPRPSRAPVRARTRPPASTPAPAPRRAIQAPAPVPARPRETQTRLSFSPGKSDIEIIDDELPRANTTRQPSPPMSARRPSRAAGTAATAKLTNLYSQSAAVDREMANPNPNPNKRPRTSRVEVDDDEEDDFSVDFDDSFLRQIEEVEATAGVNKANHIDEDGDDEWDLEDDDSFLRQVDEVERRVTQPAVEERKTSRFFQTSTTGNGSRSTKPVYVVDSDGDSAKENHEPDIVYISD